MLGFVVKTIDFGIIGSIKLILTKIELQMKWFMFEYIHVKVSSTKKIECKNQFYNKKLQFLTHDRINSWSQNQFYTSRVNYGYSKIETTHPII
jgi:hypothetical protein